jgi:hypothetical protein
MKNPIDYYVDLDKVVTALNEDPHKQAQGTYDIGNLVNVLNRCMQVAFPRFGGATYLRESPSRGFRFFAKTERPYRLPYGFRDLVSRLTAFTAWSDSGTLSEVVHAIFMAMVKAEEDKITSLPDKPVEVEDQHTVEGYDA